MARVLTFNPHLPFPEHPPRERVLMVKSDAIGDCVLATCLLPHLRARFSSAEIFVLCREHITEVFSRSPHVDEVIGFDPAKARGDQSYLLTLIGGLQALKFDYVINSVQSPDVLTHALSLGSQGKKSIALQGDGCNIRPEEQLHFLQFYTQVVGSMHPRCSEIVRYRDLLLALGVEACALSPEIPLLPEEESFAEALFAAHGLQQEKTIALFNGAQQGFKSYWRYEEALGPSLREGGFSVVALGSAEQREMHDVVLGSLKVPALNLCGRTTSIGQAASILRRCRLAVGVDTSLAHIACAVGTPQVVILGGGHFGRFFPYSPTTSVAALPLECFHCNWYCRHQTYPCISELEPFVVEAAVRSALSAPAPLARVYVAEGAPRLRIGGAPAPHHFSGLEAQIVSVRSPAQIPCGATRA